MKKKYTVYLKDPAKNFILRLQICVGNVTLKICMYPYFVYDVIWIHTIYMHHSMLFKN